MFRPPLFGVRILELATSWAGSYCGRLLADMGAEVIKIEAIDHPDPLRALSDPSVAMERPWNKSPSFNHLNRNKYGCALDLTNPRGKQLLLALTTQTDVIIENLGPEVIRDLGLDYQRLQQSNPGSIFISIRPLNQAPELVSGLCHLSGYQDGPPLLPEIAYGEFLAGTAAAATVPLALWHRRRTGRGQYIEIDPQENLINFIGEYIVAFSINGVEPPRMGNRHPSMAPHSCYPCLGDDQWIAIACEDDRQFASLCTVMDQPYLAHDPRFAAADQRYRHQDVLDLHISNWTRGKTKEEITEVLATAGVPASPVFNVSELFADSHLRARGFFETVAHSEAGVWDLEGPPWQLSDSPSYIRLPAPAFGEHNDYVLQGLLGLPEEEIAALREGGIITDTPKGSGGE